MLSFFEMFSKPLHPKKTTNMEPKHQGLVSDDFAVASSRGTFLSCAALGQVFSCPGSHIDEDADVLAPRSDI